MPSLRYEHAGRCHEHNLQFVAAALAGRAIPHWLIRDDGFRYRVATPAASRLAALNALAQASDSTPWYAELSTAEREASAVIAVSDLPAADAASSAAALRVFQSVVTSSRSLSLGPRYGCDLEFRVEDGDTLRAPWPTLLGTVIRQDTSNATLSVNGRNYPTFEPFTRTLISDISFPIDAVFTWVDGNDPAWRARRDAVRAGRGDIKHLEAVDEARFRSRDELRYALRSIEMFAPWLRHVWIITEGHSPSWLYQSHPRVTVVNHREIFGDRGLLPTFNSFAIETQLHHLDGLTEHFVYFNDDVFLGSPVAPATFFEPSGLSRFFPSSSAIAFGPITDSEHFTTSAAKNNRMLIERDFAHTLTHAVKHAPYALRRSVLAELDERWADAVALTAASQFRSRQDVSVASSLYQHYAYLTGRAIPAKIRSRYLNTSDRADLGQLDALLASRRVEAFCLNDTAEGDLPADEQRAILINFLERYFPYPAGSSTRQRPNGRAEPRMWSCGLARRRRRRRGPPRSPRPRDDVAELGRRPDLLDRSRPRRCARMAQADGCPSIRVDPDRPHRHRRRW